MLIAVGLLLLLVIGYGVALRLTLDVSRVGPGHTANYRDSVYLVLHVSFLAAAAALGFVAGKWLGGMGFAYAALFIVAVAVCMMGTQLGTQALACHGHNDLLRHWTC